MGIGLTLIKELVEMMGGTIGWTSREDAGSTFWIELGIGCPIVDSREGSTSGSSLDRQILARLAMPVTGRKG